MIGREITDTKSFKLSNLGNQSFMEKELLLGNCMVNFEFKLREPTKQKEMEDIPVKRIKIDSFPEPFRGG